MADIHPDDLSFAIKVLYAGEFFAIIAVATSKTSFAITLLRLSPKPWQRYVLWFIIVSLNLAMWLCAMFQYLQCSPVNKLWDFTVPGKCWDPMVQIHYAMFAGCEFRRLFASGPGITDNGESAYSAAMDFALALIPWVIMWRLQMKRAEKLGISLAMSLGVLAGIAAAVKTSYLNDIARSTDFTYTSANLLVWAGCETAVTIMGSSVPYFRLAIREASRKSMARSRYAGSYQLDDAGMDSGGPRSYNPSKSSRIGRTTVVESGSGRQWDSGSDKEILGSQGKDMGNAIVMTSRITVEHH